MSPAPSRKPRRAARRALYAGSLVALLLVCAAWSGLWLLAVWLAQNGLHGWMAREARSGRVWTCQKTHFSGFPFALDVVCAEPTFAGMVAGAEKTARVAQARASMQVLQPGLVHLALEGPLHVEAPRLDQSIDFAWTRLRAQVRPAPQTRESLSLAIDGFSARLTQNGVAQPPWSAAHLSLDVRPSAQATDAYGVALNATQALSPPVAEWLASAAPVDLLVRATVAQAARLLADPSLGGVEDWRRSGGAVAIERAHFSQDQARLDASGKLSLDAAHRLQGQLQAQAFNIGPLLTRLGAPDSIAAADSLVDGLFGGAPAKGGAAGGLSLPITLGDGLLSIGPFLTSVRLDPLY